MLASEPVSLTARREPCRKGKRVLADGRAGVGLDDAGGVGGGKGEMKRTSGRACMQALSGSAKAASARSASNIGWAI